MKRGLFTLAAVALTTAAFVALEPAPAPAAEPEFYAALSLGGNPAEMEDVIGTASLNEFEARGEVGADFGDFRLGVEYTYLPHRAPLGGVDRDDSLILMGYYDFADRFGATPFVGAGIGWEASGAKLGNPLGQLAVGASRPVSERVDGFVVYSYRFDLDAGLAERGKAVLVGARYMF